MRASADVYNMGLGLNVSDAALSALYGLHAFTLAREARAFSKTGLRPRQTMSRAHRRKLRRYGAHR